MPMNLCYETNVSDWHMWKTIQNSQYPFLLMLFARKMHPVLSIRIFCNVDLNNMFYLSKYVVNVNITKDTKVGVIAMKYIYTNLTYQWTYDCYAPNAKFPPFFARFARYFIWNKISIKIWLKSCYKYNNLYYNRKHVKWFYYSDSLFIAAKC